MTDLQISAHTKLSGGADFQAMADQSVMHVWLWDLGPAKPVAPVRPKAPTEKEGTPAYDLAMVDFREAIADYEAALKIHKLARDAYLDFERRFGGPHEIMQFSCDAQDTLVRDPKRYCVSSRTRGSSSLKNRGLPIGVKPGPGQAEQERREREGESELAAIRRADPVFGTHEARP